MLTPAQPTECMQARGAASLRLDGPLPELDELRLHAHLASCAECLAFAGEVAAIAALLEAAPLEQPDRAMFVPHTAKRRPVFQPRLAAAVAAVLLVAATAGSFALGRTLGGHAPPRLTASGAADVLGLRADSTQQHLLAMIARLPPVDSLRVGKAVAL
jgi:hypothetical protein